VRGRKLVAIASGANTNFDRLRFVAERAEVGRPARDDPRPSPSRRPGSFKKFCATLGARNITGVQLTASPIQGCACIRRRRCTAATSPRKSSRSSSARAEHARPVGRRDGQLGTCATWSGARSAFDPEDARHAADELLYRFEFPERPGALMNFSRAMRTDWNISLFHYRNQGSDTAGCWSACRCRATRCANSSGSDPARVSVRGRKPQSRLPPVSGLGLRLLAEIIGSDLTA